MKQHREEMSWSTQDTVLEMQTLLREGHVQRTFQGLRVLVLQALPLWQYWRQNETGSKDLRGLAVRYML